jgi:uncharacterized linocin/CFP29 family protein
MADQFLGVSRLNLPGAFIRNGVINRAAMYRALVDNRTLREDETRQIEEALTRVARRDLAAVADLQNAGLTVPLNNIGKTSYEFDRVAPVGPATQSMSILNLGERDLVRFARTAVPIPVTASQFELDARRQAAGTTIGEPIDVTNVEEHTRSVAETMEDTLVNGSDVVLGANTLPGYTNFGAREQLSFSDAAWPAISGDLTPAVTDVLAARTALRDNGFTGPYNLYLSANFDGVIDEDYKASTSDSRTLRERLLAIDGVQAIRILPSLADDQVLLVQMTSSVVVWASGQDMTTVTWDMMGGLATRWAILNVGAPALKEAYSRAPLSEGELPDLTTAAGIAHIA